ncbi:hypothetical protein DMB92_06510 [Campylobacter sp. MIT 99-7217]|uniref:hypothetical protein n=1 Tax=Campylobacter sp. MIT 99-7217 TaxID=535091 RepID=UPI0011595DD8|nr:hypothetical protein [Campylobacter sp. MIT 99-7217]TQR31337.1 hypothetical protein DMB92_06510 [Campylobacter sp. MIT 99-7217]
MFKKIILFTMLHVLCFAQNLCFESKDFYLVLQNTCSQDERVCKEVILQKIDKKTRQTINLKGELRINEYLFKQGMKDFIIRGNEFFMLDYGKLVGSFELFSCE